MNSARRPLENLISELADSMVAMSWPSANGLRATAIELTLPVETRVIQGPKGLGVETDMPRTHTRTYFDFPVGRLILTLAEVPVEAWP